MGVLYYVAGRWMKVPAAKLVWSLTPGREGLSGLPHHKKPAQSGLTEGWVIYPPYRMGVPADEPVLATWYICSRLMRGKYKLKAYYYSGSM